MRHSSFLARFSLLFLPAILACGPSEPSSEDRATLLKADALFAQGDRAAALAIYESALGFDAPSHRTLGRLGIARIREIDHQFETTRSQLRKLGVELSSRPSEAASKAFEAVLTAARGQERFAELEAEAATLREKAKQSQKAVRENELKLLDQHLAHNAMHIALFEITLMESRRVAGDTADIPGLIARVYEAADQHAANALAKVPVDPKSAVSMLDDLIEQLGGTPAATVVVAERMKRKMEIYAKKPTGPGVTGTDGH